jgi:hypothetical protein
VSALFPSFGLLLDWWPGSDLRASLSSKDIPEDIKARLLAMHEENVRWKEQLKTAQEKLIKARAVCVNFLPKVTMLDFRTPVHQIARQALQRRTSEIVRVDARMLHFSSCYDVH